MEKWFLEINLTYDATLPTSLIKRTNIRMNQKINPPLETKRFF